MDLNDIKALQDPKRSSKRCEWFKEPRQSRRLIEDLVDIDFLRNLKDLENLEGYKKCEDVKDLTDVKDLMDLKNVKDVKQRLHLGMYVS